MTDTAYFDDTDFGLGADEPAAAITAGAGSGVGRLEKAAAREDISKHLTGAELARLGQEVVDDWHRDRESNKEWRERAEEALCAAAQERPEAKDYPFKGAANVRYPLLTIAGLQFAARAYPAIIKGDEAIKHKVLGPDPTGEKLARAERRSKFMNWQLFYKVDGWEQDTDALLHRLPAVGQHFRKVYYDPIEQRCAIESVSALRLTIPADARSLRSSPRITHDFDRYPYELQRLMAAGAYRRVTLTPESDDAQAPRLILEQHRMMDLDGDGLDEPYVVTVDHATAEVLRIEEGFDRELDVQWGEDENILAINRWCPFVDYGFIPDPKGRAYSIGFGHLLTPIMDVVNTTINLMIDAGHAQVAGGGFISQELRLQGPGQGGVLRWQPGEYKTVNASAADVRNAIIERTLPNPSPVLFQLLGMLMEAAKDIASVNEAITGDAARTAPVGTTLALIEQGQQVFNAIYKRIYRSLREEFRLFAECLRRYGDPNEYLRFIDPQPAPAAPPMLGHNGGPAMAPEMAQDGLSALSQGLMPAGMQTPAQVPQIDAVTLFEQDFDDDDLDIQPVSDPSTVTKLQVVSRDQYALAFVGKGIYADDRAVVRQALINVGIEQADQWIPEQLPPNPMQQQAAALELAEREAKAKQAAAAGELSLAKAAEIANRNTGAQADAEIAAVSARAMKDQAQAAQIAAGLIPSDPALAPMEGEQ